MSYETIRYEVQGRAAVVTLSRPEVLNALNDQMREELGTALRIADEDEDVRVVVVTGTGRAFSSGAELGGSRRRETVNDWFLSHERNDRWAASIHELHKPTIAAVNGICYGAGLILAAHCDLLVAADDSRFSLIEARMGSAGAAVLPYLIGPQWTKFLILTGEVIEAAKAKEIGLVLEVAPAAALLERVLDLARRIGAMPPIGTMLNKRGVDGTLDLMGWSNNVAFHRSHAAVTDAMMEHAVADDGRKLRAILREEGWDDFKQARDRPFESPWLSGNDDA
jgi:enoyl-CoA hydratase/carnithine racemase